MAPEKAKAKKAIRGIKENAPVVHLGVGKLERTPLHPVLHRRIVIILVVIACLIGSGMLWWAYNITYGKTARMEEATEANLAKEQNYNIPHVAPLALMDDNEIVQTLIDKGFNLYMASQGNEGDFEASLIALKLPDGVDEETMSKLYKKGADKMNSEEASLYFNGSWTLEIYRNQGTDIVIRYVDFASGTPEMAIHNAIEQQGYTEPLVNSEDRGTDSSGNTFSTGTTSVDDETLTWRVTSLPFLDMYSVSGMPQTACCVTIRVQAA